MSRTAENRDAYEDAYRLYREVYFALKPVFGRGRGDMWLMSRESAGGNRFTGAGRHFCVRGGGQAACAAALPARSCSARAEPSEVSTASSRGSSLPADDGLDMAHRLSVNECSLGPAAGWTAASLPSTQTSNRSCRVGWNGLVRLIWPGGPHQPAERVLGPLEAARQQQAAAAREAEAPQVAHVDAAGVVRRRPRRWCARRRTGRGRAGPGSSRRR